MQTQIFTRPGTTPGSTPRRARLYDSPGRPRRAEMKLARWLDEQGKTREWLSEQLGISLSYVHKLCSGERLPGRDLILRIDEITNHQVTFADWVKSK